MSAISNSHSRAKVMLIDYMKRNNLNSFSEIEDIDDLFRTLAERGDVETFRDLRIFFEVLNEQHLEYDGETYDFNCLDSLYNAALCGHWDLIQTILEPYPSEINEFDEIVRENSDKFFDMIDGAIEGGHLHILEEFEKDRRLSFLVNQFDPVSFRMCVRYRRYHMLEFFLIRRKRVKIEDIQIVTTEMFQQADDEGIKFLLERFPDSKRFVARIIQKQNLNDYTRPEMGIASSQELMPDIELINRLQRIQWLTQ